MARSTGILAAPHPLQFTFGTNRSRDGLAPDARDYNAVGRGEETQRVIMLGGGFDLDDTLTGLCEALDIDVIRVASHHDLPLALHRHTPMAVVSAMEVGRMVECSALRSIAAYNPDLPVLLITGDDPALEGFVDVAEQLWGMTQLCRLPEQPGPQDMIRFLFIAGQEAGTGRLMPVS
jgi:hypothetical protein